VPPVPPGAAAGAPPAADPAPSDAPRRFRLPFSRQRNDPN
jgi:hypothetical protein